MVAVKQANMGHENVVWHAKDLFGLEVCGHEIWCGLEPDKNRLIVGGTKGDFAQSKSEAFERESKFFGSVKNCLLVLGDITKKGQVGLKDRASKRPLKSLITTASCFLTGVGGTIHKVKDLSIFGRGPRTRTANLCDPNAAPFQLGQSPMYAGILADGQATFMD